MGNLQPGGVAAILSVHSKNWIFFKCSYVASFFTFLCVCLCVLQGLVMDSQNGFSQKKFFLCLVLVV